MSPRAPWAERDCELTRAAVEALLAAQAPALQPGTIRYLNEGWDSWVYAARDGEGGEWILRFPKKAEVARRLEREIALLPLLAPRLPLLVPRFEWVGRPGAGYPHRFAGYPRLPGRPAIECAEDAFDAAALGSALGAFLAALHGFPVAEARRLGIEPDDAGTPDEDAEDARQMLAGIGSALPPRERAAALALLGRPPPASEAAVLAHTDFFLEHVVVDRGRPVGVIDWSDVAIGDPGVDLGGLYSWMGEPMLAAGLSLYCARRGLDAGARTRLAARARFASVCRAAEDLDYGVRAGRDEYTASALRALGHLGEAPVET
jgi:aminoglycoside phosphotransferase (APT) family kinase protein